MGHATDMARLPSIPDPMKGMLDEFVFSQPAANATSGQLDTATRATDIFMPTSAEPFSDGPTGPTDSARDPMTALMPAVSLSLPDIPGGNQHLSSPFEMGFPSGYSILKTEQALGERRHSGDSSHFDNTDFADSGGAAPSPHVADAGQIRRSSRQRKRSSYVPTESDEDWAPTKEKRPVGRPIAYKGDPDAPHLTDAERRQIKRRIANRDSARRVRQRKQEDNAELEKQLRKSLDRERAMMEHIRASERATFALQQQIKSLNAQLQASTASQQALQQQLVVKSRQSSENVRHLPLMADDSAKDMDRIQAGWEPSGAGCG